MGSRDDLPPKVLQAVGLLGMFVCFGFWAVVDRVEPAFIAGFGTLAVYGQYQAAKGALRNGHGDGGSP